MNIESLITIVKNTNADAWKITESKKVSEELFFIKKDLQMNRSTNIHEIQVTLYKDFEINGIKYRGSSTFNIHPTMIEAEIESLIESNLLAAGFVKNKFYTLPDKSELIPLSNETEISKSEISAFLKPIIDSIFINDNNSDCFINSVEIFLTRVETRIINSNGIDVVYNRYPLMIEYITNAKNDKEEIEIYDMVQFGDFDRNYLETAIKEKLEMAVNRAKARKTPNLGNCTVLLTGDPVKTFLEYYPSQTSAAMIYQKFSTFKEGDNIQGEEINGDKITLSLLPTMKNSTFSAPYDQDGITLQDHTIIEGGIIKKIHGNAQMSYYLGMQPTGSIPNTYYECGIKNIEELKSDPYLETLIFSDFQLDDITGDFAGEIRFAWYFDGKERIPVTGGSIAGNIKEKQNNFYFSKERQQLNNFSGPKTIKLSEVSITGAE